MKHPPTRPAGRCAPRPPGVKGCQSCRSTRNTLIHNAVTSLHNNDRLNARFNAGFNASLCGVSLLLRRWPLPMPRIHRLLPYR